jgi:hypothetical protein
MLRAISPLIWRRIVVRDDWTLDQLHRVLQVAMGWEDSHLYEFHVEGRKYRVPDSENEPRILDAKRTLIRQVFRAIGARSEYMYDFGDHWRHDLQLEAIWEPDPKQAYPRCL